MADLRECFSVIQDDVSGAGECLISRIEGEAAAAKEGLIGFSFKDSSGNVVLPQLDSQGRLPVIVDAVAGTCIHENGELAAGSNDVLADVTGASATLTVGKTYTKIGIMGSCLRASLFQLQYIDDDGGAPTTTVLGEFLVGPGQYSFCCELHCRELDTTGGTGTQTLKLQAKNFAGSPSNVSSLRGAISALELV
jgi:hypothetical protein